MLRFADEKHDELQVGETHAAGDELLFGKHPSPTHQEATIVSSVIQVQRYLKSLFITVKKKKKKKKKKKCVCVVCVVLNCCPLFLAEGEGSRGRGNQQPNEDRRKIV